MEFILNLRKYAANNLQLDLVTDIDEFIDQYGLEYIDTIGIDEIKEILQEISAARDLEEGEEGSEHESLPDSPPPLLEFNPKMEIKKEKLEAIKIEIGNGEIKEETSVEEYLATINGVFAADEWDVDIRKKLPLTSEDPYIKGFRKFLKVDVSQDKPDRADYHRDDLLKILTSKSHAEALAYAHAKLIEDVFRAKSSSEAVKTLAHIKSDTETQLEKLQRKIDKRKHQEKLEKAFIAMSLKDKKSASTRGQPSNRRGDPRGGKRGGRGGRGSSGTASNPIEI